MAGLGNALTTLIITDGLFIGDGITSVFEFGSLFRVSAGRLPLIIPDDGSTQTKTSSPHHVHISGGGGGSGGTGGFRPLGTNQIQPYIVPRDQESKYFQRNNIINVHFSIAGRTIEKTFAVSESRARMTFKVINLMNATKKQLNVSVKNIKHVATMTVARVRNLRLVRKSGK